MYNGFSNVVHQKKIIDANSVRKSHTPIIPHRFHRFQVETSLFLLENGEAL